MYSRADERVFAWFLELNKTGAFSKTLLNYLVQSYSQVETLYADASAIEMSEGDRAYQQYVANVDANFSIQDFFMNAG